MSDTQKAPASLPEDVLIIVPVRNTVLFPKAVLPISANRRQSIAGIQEAVRAGRKIGIVLQRDTSVEEPEKKDLHPIGVSANILRYLASNDGSHNLVLAGEKRFRILDFLHGFPFLVARVETLEEPVNSGKEVAARALYLRQKAEETLQLLANEPGSMLASALIEIQEPGRLADVVTAFMDIDAEGKQKILNTLDLEQRLNLVIDNLTEQLNVLRLSKEIEDQTRGKFDAQVRERMLREQLETIRRELGEGDGPQVNVEEFQQAIENAGMPEAVKKEVKRELGRLSRMSEQAAEYAMLRTWIELMIDLPWSKIEPENIDINRARAVLDEDHHGLEKVKRRILEFLAVRKLNPEGKSPILCLAGPPGVGKTSLGKSIARAIGVKFTRTSLGGVHDEAEIRGHRRTYIGALPGNIIRYLRKAGSRNPVFMLDEIDKLGRGIQGDPASALLEVLDPEQNNSFGDNYLGVPFDLSRVLFIATANVLDAIPPPLRDRMEVIEIPGYTLEEKIEIAKKYLIARQLKSNGLTPKQVTLNEDAIKLVIQSYTREAGVRNLEREIGALLRNSAMRIVSGETDHIFITKKDVNAVLGSPIFEPELAMRTGVAGVATGLAWTPAGGDILFIEATRSPGKGNFILTGQLGDVMRESAQAALSLVKSRAVNLGLDVMFDQNEIHVHVPAGAIQKDGPSAGVALFIALVSLFTGRPVRNDVAMTGEISLRGLVLPVGGIKEKCLAALRAGIKTVVLPARNRKDLQDIPEAAKQHLHFIWLDNVDQAVEVAFARDKAVVNQ